MKILQYFVLLMILGSMFTACSTRQAVSAVKEPRALPSWYLNPPNNSSEYLYGIGEGANLEEAKKKALESMVSQLGVSVASNYQSRLNVHKSYGESFTKETTFELKSEVAKIRISNYEVMQSEKLGYKQFVVLVHSDKGKFTQALQKELTHKIEAVQTKHKSVKVSDALSRYAFYDKSIKELNAMFSTVLVLDTLENTKNHQEYFDLVTQLDFEFQSLKQTMTFSVESDSSSKAFQEEIVVALGNDQKRITKHRDDRDHIAITLHSDTQYARAHGFDIARTVLVIEVKDSTGKMIGGNRVNLTGHATQGKQVALNDAAKKLKAMLHEKGIGDIVGLDI